MHEHKHHPTHHSTETCACGAMRVVERAAVVARRDAATRAFKQRYNEAWYAREATR